MRKISIIIVISVVLLIEIFYLLLKDKKEIKEPEQNTEQIVETLKKEDVILQDLGNNKYTFEYKNETFNANYTPDNWQIIDSYKITNVSDITIICEVLIEKHKVHGIDMTSYREPTDMAYEWMQHNLAYQLLPENNSFRNNAKDVDLDPRDQNKSLKEMYEDRTGKEFKIEDFLK